MLRALQTIAAAAALALGLAAGPAGAAEPRPGVQLLMLDEAGCSWCQRWEEEVGVVYEKTAEGRAAPLVQRDIRSPLPEGVTLARRAHYTPTFVLLRDGAEVGRIEGYPGEDFFYGLLGRMLRETAPPAGPTH